MKAALLSAQAESGKGVYLKIEELDEANLTPCHLPQINTCDLPSGAYVWIPDPTGLYGGAFEAKHVIETREEYAREIAREKAAKL